MGKLCVADIDRWDPGEISAVFGISTNIADHSISTSGNLEKLSVFESWNSTAADASKHSISKTRKDLDRHGEVARKVGDAARKAEQEVQDVKDSLKRLRGDVSAAGFMLDPHTDTITDPHPPSMDGWSQDQVDEYQEKLDKLNFNLAALLTAALVADHDLATAINNADGDWNIVQWEPSLADVVLGGSAGLTGAKTDIIQDIWRKSIGENPTAAESKVLPWLKELDGLKVSRVGGVVGVLTAIPSVFADHAEGNSWGEAVAREGAGTVAGVAAAAATGAALGSFAPGVGTVTGALIGAGVGIFASYGTSKGIDWLWD